MNVGALDTGVLGQISFRNPKTATSRAYLVKKTSLTETETFVESLRAQFPGLAFKLHQVYEDSTGRGRLAGVRDWVVEFSEPQRKIFKQLITIETDSYSSGNWKSDVVAVSDASPFEFCSEAKNVNHLS